MRDKCLSIGRKSEPNVHPNDSPCNGERSSDFAKDAVSGFHLCARSR
jgi:hypothetical protein